MAKSKVVIGTSPKTESRKGSNVLKRAEIDLERKKQELIRAKKRHRKLAGEFIDLWVKLRRLKRNEVSKLELK